MFFKRKVKKEIEEVIKRRSKIVDLYAGFDDDREVIREMKLLAQKLRIKLGGDCK